MHFYYFSHFIQRWILPPGINLLLIALGFLILQYSKPLGKSLIAIAFISLWLFSTPVIAQLLINHLQTQYPRLRIDQISQQSRSAIVVLGGGHTISPQSKGGYVLSGATEFRLRYAAMLYHQTHFPIIVSGGGLNKSSRSEAEYMREEMKTYFGIPVAWKENKSANTRDEGNLVLPILKKHGIKVAYVVTNAWHMPRAMYAFYTALKNKRITGIKVIAAPMGYEMILQSNQRIMNYLPSFTALDTSVIAMHEYIGMWWYQLANLFIARKLQ